MARNKVEIVNGSTTTVLLDVSGTTATPETVLTGYTFTQADGTQATGTLESYQMSLSDDGTELNFVWGGSANTFTISLISSSTSVGSVTITVEEGMTWAEWCDSDYATENSSWSFDYGTDSVGFRNEAGVYGDIKLNGTVVLPSDVIQNTEYTLYAKGSSGGA